MMSETWLSTRTGRYFSMKFSMVSRWFFEMLSYV